MGEPTTIDAYLAALTPGRRERLEAVRALVHARYPDVVETIEWRMPVFRRGERYLALASRAGCVSLYLGEALADRVAASDPKLKRGKGCINVPDSRPMPLDALADVLAERLGGD